MSDTEQSAFLQRADEWYETYEALTNNEERITHFLTLLQSGPIELDDWEQAYIGSPFLDLWAELWGQRDFDAVFALFEAFRTLHPAIYQHEFVYFAHEQFDYAWYKSLPALAEESVVYFENDPNRDIDSFLKFRTKLWYLLDAERGERMAQKTFAAVADKEDDYMGAPHHDLAFDIFFTALQRATASLQPGESLDFTPLKNLLTEYLPDHRPELFLHFDHALTTPWDLEEAEKKFGSKDEQIIVWSDLHFRFMIWMLRRGFPFVTSDAIFKECREYWSEKNKKANTLKAHCRFTYDGLDHFLGSKQSFLTPAISDIFAMLWCLPFVNDFLLEHGIADAEAYAHTKQAVIDNKRVILKNLGSDLWTQSYLHTIWPKPDSVEPSEWAAEAAIFATSFQFSGSSDEFAALNAASFSQLPEAIQHKPKSKAPLNDEDVFSDALKPRGSNYTPPKKKKKKKK